VYHHLQEHLMATQGTDLCPMCATGFPVLMIAFLGGYVHSLVPNVMSFTDFVRRRFGPVVQIYVSLLMLFNSK
jgi:Na+/proline symporter